MNERAHYFVVGVLTGAGVVLTLAFLALLAGCADVETAVDNTADLISKYGTGRVYACVDPDGGEHEWCWPKDSQRAELERLMDVTCTDGHRPWWPDDLSPLLCSYSCPPPEHGCNAHDGCACVWRVE